MAATPQDEIHFFYNWNLKLNCRTFTTFRLKNEAKYTIGKYYKVYLSKTLFGFYRIIDIKTLKLAAVNDWVALIDSGYNAKEFRQIVADMYKNKPNIDVNTADFYLILLTQDNATQDGQAT